MGLGCARAHSCDNTEGSDLWRPTRGDILGRSEIVIPGAMPVLLLARSPIVAAPTAAGFAVYLVLGLWAPPRRRPGAQLSTDHDAVVEAVH
jgi:hypothetical protein